MTIPTEEQLKQMITSAKAQIVATWICIAAGYIINWHVLVWVSIGWGSFQALGLAAARSVMKNHYGRNPQA